jgi:alanine dehydrogenase
MKSIVSGTAFGTLKRATTDEVRTVRRLDFAAVQRLGRIRDLIEPLREAFRRGAHTPPRSHHELTENVNPGTLLVMPAWRRGGPIGVKLVTVFPENARRGRPSVAGEYLLFDGKSGEAVALIEGSALTLLRTAAVSALAADILAPSHPKVLLMIGTGALAQHLIEGHAAVRDYQRVLIWGRDSTKAAAVAERVSKLGPVVDVAEDLTRAVSEADVISCATMAQQPLVRGSWLKTVAHLDLVGSFKPTMREADEECFRRASAVAVDTLDALKESGDLIDPIASGALSTTKVTPLSRMINERPGTVREGVTVFKSVGHAIADLATAEWLLKCGEN